MGKYRYREVKNYIHNELKLTREDIKEIMIPIVKEEVKRIFHNTYGNDVDIERWVRRMVSDEIICNFCLSKRRKCKISYRYSKYEIQ